MGNFLKEGKKKEMLIRYMYAVGGCFVYSIGFNMLIVPMGMYSGGFTGVSQLFEWVVVNLIGITIPESLNFVGIIYFALNVPLFFLAYKVMSKDYALRSVLIVGVLSVTLLIVPIPANRIVEDYLTASIIGGIICGAGGGLILRGRMAGGGQDIIGVCCSKLFPNFTVGKVTIMINTVVYLFCFFIYDIQMVIYSLIFGVVYSLAVDKVHTQNINMNVIIITKKRGISQTIIDEMKRGVTNWDGEGAYTHQTAYILFVMISKYELPQLKKIVHDIDPQAFMIYSEGWSIDGNFEKRL